MTERVLTGITPSGTPHLGNYVGAIRPAITASRAPNVESFFFLADLHSLIKAQNPERTQRSTLEIAASWLACGLKPEPGKVWFYRQSDIPEITELNWLLTVIAGKGLLNRAHAYKAAVDKNRHEAQDDDAAITAGLYMYPVLMAADILIFNANHVPVGRDQVQHIEMARDFAQRFNHIYNGSYFTLPQAAIDEQVATLAGLDGRKMSKSYNNTIALFSPRAELKKKIASMITDARKPGEPKPSHGTALFQLYQAFSGEQQSADFAQDLTDGISWDQAKQQLFARIDQELSPLREQYQALIANPAAIENLLQENGQELRQRYAVPLLKELRHAVGLRNLSYVKTEKSSANQAVVEKIPSFKQYREKDGQFYFKLLNGNNLLIQSKGFASHNDAAQLIAQLKQADNEEIIAHPQLILHAEIERILAALRMFQD